MSIGIQRGLIGMVLRRKHHCGSCWRKTHIGGGIEGEGGGHCLVQICRPNGIGIASVAFIIAAHAPSVLSPRKAAPVHVHKHRVGQVRGHQHRCLLKAATEQIVVLEGTRHLGAVPLGQRVVYRPTDAH